MSLVERKDFINYFVKKYNYESYLEIGLSSPARTFDHIKCKIKNSVDPNPVASAEYCTTSDDFFIDLEEDLLMIPPDFKWDIIFIDGDHYHETVDRDLPNTLNHLSDGGTIVMHDALVNIGAKIGNNCILNTKSPKSSKVSIVSVVALSLYVIFEFNCGIFKYRVCITSL